MFPRLMKAYKECGFPLHCGNNNCLCAAIATEDGQDAHTGGGISITDVAFFFGLSKIFQPRRILAVGNAAGYGSFCLAEVFPGIAIDVIDAEIEGGFNAVGSELTRYISKHYYDEQVKLHIGYCPEDLDSFFHSRQYDLIFLDSLHTDEQQLKDFSALVNYATASSVIYLHDVELNNMQQSYEIIKQNQYGFACYNVDFSSFGCKALVRNNIEVESWFKIIDCSPHIIHQNPVPTLRASCKTDTVAI